MLLCFWNNYSTILAHNLNRTYYNYDPILYKETWIRWSCITCRTPVGSYRIILHGQFTSNQDWLVFGLQPLKRRQKGILGVCHSNNLANFGYILKYDSALVLNCIPTSLHHKPSLGLYIYIAFSFFLIP